VQPVDFKIRCSFFVEHSWNIMAHAESSGPLECVGTERGREARPFLRRAVRAISLQTWPLRLFIARPGHYNDFLRDLAHVRTRFLSCTFGLLSAVPTLSIAFAHQSYFLANCLQRPCGQVGVKEGGYRSAPGGGPAVDRCSEAKNEEIIASRWCKMEFWSPISLGCILRGHFNDFLRDLAIITISLQT